MVPEQRHGITVDTVADEAAAGERVAEERGPVEGLEARDVRPVGVVEADAVEVLDDQEHTRPGRPDELRRANLGEVAAEGVAGDVDVVASGGVLVGDATRGLPGERLFGRHAHLVSGKIVQPLYHLARTPVGEHDVAAPHVDGGIVVRAEDADRLVLGLGDLPLEGDATVTRHPASLAPLRK